MDFSKNFSFEMNNEDILLENKVSRVKKSWKSQFNVEKQSVKKLRKSKFHVYENSLYYSKLYADIQIFKSYFNK